MSWKDNNNHGVDKFSNVPEHKANIVLSKLLPDKYGEYNIRMVTTIDFNGCATIYKQVAERMNHSTGEDIYMVTETVCSRNYINSEDRGDGVQVFSNCDELFHWKFFNCRRCLFYPGDSPWLNENIEVAKKCEFYADLYKLWKTGIISLESAKEIGILEVDLADKVIVLNEKCSKFNDKRSSYVR